MIEDSVDTLVNRIRTHEDSRFLYSYRSSKFVPPPGKTLMMFGQTVGGTEEHLEAFPSRPRPGGWMAYWGIPSMDGVTSTFMNDTGGRQNHQLLVDRFPNAAIQSGLWMVGTWEIARNTANGMYDQVVRDFGAWAKSIDRPLYLRIGYEFDGIHNELPPADYVQAYRRIVNIMREEGVENVAFVWHSYAAPPYQGNALSAWYPGDDYVDWVGVSIFGQGYFPQGTREMDAVFEFARTKRKPVMVAESSPTEGIYNISAWNAWFVNFFSFVYEKNIKAVSFINENWERFNFPGLNWRDARLQNNGRVAEAFFRELDRERYLMASPELFEQLGYAQD